MNLRIHWLVILLALALAWPLRARSGAGNKVEPGELYGVAALFADGESHAHARRVECALEGAGVGSRDSLLGHPDPAELVAAPVYDTARAALVQLRVAASDDLGRQRFLGGLGPWLGVLACFLAWLAASAAGAGVLPSMLCALWVAVAPACVRAGEWGRLSDIAFALVPLALAVRFSARTLLAQEPLRAILGGIGSGGLAGFLLACSPAGCVPFLAGAAAFAYWTFGTSGELARFAARAGLLYALVAALVARTLMLDGPWQAEPGGLFATWVELASTLAFAASAPFLVAMAREHASAKRVFPLFVMLAAAVVIVVLAFRSVEPAQRVWQAWMQARELRPLFASAGTPNLFLALTPLAILLPAGWWFLLRRKLEPVGLYLFVLSVGALLATLVDPELAPWAVLSGAVLLARVATDWGEGTRERRWALGVCAAVLAAHAFAGLLVEPDLALHETRVEIARGLRWMRENTPSPGPWNAPRAQQDWGVLCVPARGAEVAWQARRPAVFSAVGAYGNLDAQRDAARALRGEDLVRAMHACGARYLVASPLDAEGDPDAQWGLQRVYASPRIVDSEGHALQGAGLGGPAISIWELPAPPKGSSTPQMLPR